MPADIPGYYYDEEKKKYFKILKNHSAPEGSKHTHDSIKRRKLEDQQAKETRELTNRQQSRVRKPSSILNHLNGELLLCELDAKLSMRASFVRSMTAGTRKQSILQWREDSPQITAFEYDAPGQLLFVGFSAAVQGDTAFLGKVEGVSQLNDNPTEEPSFQYTEDRVFPVSYDTSEITSICLNHDTRTLLTTYMGNGQNSNRIQLQTLTGSYIDDVRTLYRPGNLVIRGSAAAPPSSNHLFIMASDHGLLAVDSTITRSIHYLDHSETCGLSPTGGKNYTSVEFLNNHPNVICTGKLAGSVDVFDLREGPKPTETFLHRTAVTNIKGLGQHRVIVQGLGQSTCQYDIRYAKPIFSKDTNITTPFQEYPELDTGAYVDLGFDVDPYSGILAAAQANCTVQLFDIASGKRLKYCDMERKSEAGVPVKDIKFVERGIGNLWVAWKSGICSYPFFGKNLTSQN